MCKWIVIFLLMATPCWAADTEVQDLTELTDPQSTDAMYIVDDPAGTPLGKYVEVGTLFAKNCEFFKFGVQSSKISGGDITTPAPIDAGDRPWRQLFDDSTDEEGLVQGVVPACYDGTSSITVTYVFSMETTQSGDLDVEMDGAWMATTPNTDAEDFNSDGFASAQICDHNLATDQTAGYLRSCSVVFTAAQADSPAAGDGFRFLYYRNAATSDDATDDVELVGLTAEVVP